MFNALGSAGVLADAVVADLYAGSGAIGIEALSRGAATCVFVERDRAALSVLRENLDVLGLTDRSRVLASDALAIAGTIDADIVIADPPYDFDRWDQLLDRLDVDMVVGEAGRSIDPPAGWVVTRSKRYGRTWLTFIERDRTATVEH